MGRPRDVNGSLNLRPVQCQRKISAPIDCLGSCLANTGTKKTLVTVKEPAAQGRVREAGLVQGRRAEEPITGPGGLSFLPELPARAAPGHRHGGSGQWKKSRRQA